MHVEDNTAATKKEPPRTAPGAKTVRRVKDFDALIEAVESELADDRYSTGLGKLVEAVNLSRGLPDLEQRATDFAVEQATQVLPRSWRVARSLLLETADLGSQQAAPRRDLWDGIQQQERDETIRSVLNAADLASTNGMAALARQRLTALKTKYPDDPRIAPRLKAVEAQCLAQLVVEQRRQADQQAEAAKANQLLAQATWAKAREFERTGFYGEALEYWESLRKIDRHYPGLQAEISRCTALRDGPPPVAEKQSSQPPLQPASKPAPARGAPRNRVLPAATLISAALTIVALLGVSVWKYSSNPVTKPSVAKLREIKAPTISLEPPPPTPPLLSPAPPPTTQSTSAESTSSVIVSVPAAPTAAPRHPDLSPSLPEAKIDQGSSDSAPTVVVVKQPPPELDIAASQTAASIPAPPPTLQPPPDLASSAAQPQQQQQLAELELDTRIRADNEAHALAALQTAEALQQRQSAEVLAVVRQYAAAWNARNVDSILSLQHNLDRRTVKAQLSPIKSLAMNISPSANPLIEGQRATLRCRRQVSEVFEDGVAKQTPEQTVTFILAKRDGAWTIESTKQ